MRDLIVQAFKKQLIKLAIGGVVVAAGLGFRLYQVSGGETARQDAAYEEAVEQELAASGADGEDEGEGGTSLWTFTAGSEDEESVASRRAIPCYIEGRTRFMLQSDCVTRGGMPQR